MKVSYFDCRKINDLINLDAYSDFNSNYSKLNYTIRIFKVRESGPGLIALGMPILSKREAALGQRCSVISQAGKFYDRRKN